MANRSIPPEDDRREIERFREMNKIFGVSPKGPEDRDRTKERSKAAALNEWSVPKGVRRSTSNSRSLTELAKAAALMVVASFQRPHKGHASPTPTVRAANERSQASRRR